MQSLLLLSILEVKIRLQKKWFTMFNTFFQDIFIGINYIVEPQKIVDFINFTCYKLPWISLNEKKKIFPLELFFVTSQLFDLFQSYFPQKLR